jgi:hypothetical protein
MLARSKAVGAVTPWCALVVELELAAGCEAQREVVKRITALGDPQALPALKQLGQGGRRRFRWSRRPESCMEEDVERAIETLEAAQARAPDAGGG